MKKLEVGEWSEWVSREIVRSMGMSFVDVAGDRRTYWVIRDQEGRFVTFAVVCVD